MGAYLSGGCLVLAVISAGIAARIEGLGTINGEAILDGAVLLSLAWWALACLGGWGLLRGLRWALVLQWVGGTGATLTCIGGIIWAVSCYDRPSRGWTQDAYAYGLAGLAGVWLVWTLWSMSVTVLRRGLFVRTPPPEVTEAPEI